MAKKGKAVKRNRVEVWIYALRLGGKTAYIGQTSDPCQREKTHRRFKGNGLRRHKFVALFKTSPQDANQEEAKLIQHFKSIGECWLNKKMRSGPVIRYGNSIIYEGVEFQSWAELSRHLNTSVQTLKEHGIIQKETGQEDSKAARRNGKLGRRPKKTKGEK